MIKAKTIERTWPMNWLYYWLSQPTYFSQSQNATFADVVSVQASWNGNRKMVPFQHCSGSKLSICYSHWSIIIGYNWLWVSLAKCPVIHQFSSFAAHQFSTHMVTTAFILCSLKKQRLYLRKRYKPIQIYRRQCNYINRKEIWISFWMDKKHFSVVKKWSP